MTTLSITGGRVLGPDATVTRADVLVDQDTGEIVAIGDDLSGERPSTRRTRS